MECTQKDIKELLPGYAEGSLESTEQHRVQDHIASCSDCGAELELLRMMSAEEVPDPGDAFWQAMPSRIHHAVEEEKRKPKRWFDLSVLVPRPFRSPRWAWSTAVLLLVASVSWFLFRPMPPEETPTVTAVGSGYEYDLQGMSGGIDLAELDSEEIKQVGEWADSNLTQVGEALRTAWANGQETDFAEYEEFWDMDRAELKRFSEILEGAKQEV